MNTIEMYLPDLVDPQDEMSVGCNLLIKSHQAQLIDSAKDLVYVTQWKKMGEAKSQQRSLVCRSDRRGKNPWSNYSNKTKK